MIKKLILLTMLLFPGVSQAQIGPWTFTPTFTRTPTGTLTPSATPTFTQTPAYVAGLDLENTQLQILKLQQAAATRGIPVVYTPTVTSTPTGSATPTNTPTVNLTSTVSTNTPTATSTPTPNTVIIIPVVTVVPLGRYSVNPAASATPAVFATAIPSATPYFHKVVVTYNNPGTAGGGLGIWVPTKLGGADVIAPAGGMGSGSSAFVVLYGPGIPLSISGPDCTLGSAAGATITGYIWDYQSLTPFSDMQR